MEVSWTRHALASLDEVFQFIAQDSPEAARRWVARLARRAETAADMPLAGRIVPELGRDDVREIFLRTYRIVYRVRPDRVTILVVFNGRRLLRDDDVDDE